MPSKYIKKYLKLTIKRRWKNISKMILHVLKDEMATSMGILFLEEPSISFFQNEC
jgi:hypothetical protein